MNSCFLKHSFDLGNVNRSNNLGLFGFSKAREENALKHIPNGIADDYQYKCQAEWD